MISTVYLQIFKFKEKSEYTVHLDLLLFDWSFSYQSRQSRFLRVPPLDFNDFFLLVLSQADSYGNEKLIRKWTKFVFCFVFFNLMGTRMVQIRIAKFV